MSTVTQQRSRYDWNRAHEERARRESELYRRDSQLVVEQNRQRREHQRRESRIQELLDNISDPYKNPARVDPTRSPSYTDQTFDLMSPVSPSGRKTRPPQYFP